VLALNHFIRRIFLLPDMSGKAALRPSLASMEALVMARVLVALCAPAPDDAILGTGAQPLEW
jgi:hypothetical protein